VAIVIGESGAWKQVLLMARMAGIVVNKPSDVGIQLARAQKILAEEELRARDDLALREAELERDLAQKQAAAAQDITRVHDDFEQTPETFGCPACDVAPLDRIVPPDPASTGTGTGTRAVASCTSGRTCPSGVSRWTGDRDRQARRKHSAHCPAGRSDRPLGHAGQCYRRDAMSSRRSARCPTTSFS